MGTLSSLGLFDPEQCPREEAKALQSVSGLSLKADLLGRHFILIPKTLPGIFETGFLSCSLLNSPMTVGTIRALCPKFLPFQIQSLPVWIIYDKSGLEDKHTGSTWLNGPFSFSECSKAIQWSKIVFPSKHLITAQLLDHASELALANSRARIIQK